jgi:hypothetical protein
MWAATGIPPLVGVFAYAFVLARVDDLTTTGLVVAFTVMALGALGAFFVPVLVLRLSRLQDCAEASADYVRRSRSRRILRILGWAVPGVAAYILLLGMPLYADLEAREVRAGGTFSSPFFPWKALPVRLVWTGKAERIHFTNTCKSLRYLGESGGTLLLYDTIADKAYRVRSNEASVQIVKGCDESPPRAPAMVDGQWRQLLNCKPDGNRPRRRVTIKSRSGEEAALGSLFYSSHCQTVWGSVHLKNPKAARALRLTIQRKARRIHLSKQIKNPGSFLETPMLSARPGCVSFVVRVVDGAGTGPPARLSCRRRR